MAETNDLQELATQQVECTKNSQSLLKVLLNSEKEATNLLDKINQKRAELKKALKNLLITAGVVIVVLMILSNFR